MVTLDSFCQFKNKQQQKKNCNNRKSLVDGIMSLMATSGTHSFLFFKVYAMIKQPIKVS